MPTDEKISNRQALRLQPLSEILLYKLYRLHIEDDDNSSYNLDDLKAIFRGEVSAKMIFSALGYLNYERYGKQTLIKRHGKAGFHSYSISNDGIFHIESSLNRRNTIATYLSNNTSATVSEIAGFEGIFYNTTERMDIGIWEPLNIDREKQEYKDVVLELDQALEIIRGDNGFAEQMPETRNGIVNTLQDGIRRFKTIETNISQISALIIKPLQWVLTNFGRTIMGEAAKKAAEKITSFLSSLF